MATYNGARFIREQLESLACQKKLPCELVVCDDGSKDDTLEIVAAFARGAPFQVHVHRNEQRLGFANNFLKAASLCQGRWIAFCDQDDIWLPEKLQVCATALEDPKVVLVTHSAALIDQDGRALGRDMPKYLRSRVAPPLEMVLWFIPPGFTQVFAASLLDIARCQRRPQSHVAPAGVPKTHDEWVYFIATVVGHTSFLQQKLCLYRQHASNTCGVPDVTLSRSISQASHTGAQQYNARASLCEEQAQCLKALAERSAEDGGDREAARVRLLDGAAFYLRAAAMLRLRAGLYGSGSQVTEKLSRLRRLIGHGAYRQQERGGFGLRSLLKDCAYMWR